MPISDHDLTQGYWGCCGVFSYEMRIFHYNPCFFSKTFNKLCDSILSRRQFTFWYEVHIR